MNISFEKFRGACKHNGDFEDIECNPICTLMTPALTKPGSHAYTGKEILCSEGNCPFIETEAVQKEKKASMKIENEIMMKVARKEAYLRDFKRCLAVKICPRCGGNLNVIGKEYICLSAACALKNDE